MATLSIEYFVIPKLLLNVIIYTISYICMYMYAYVSLQGTQIIRVIDIFYIMYSGKVRLKQNICSH